MTDETTDTTATPETTTDPADGAQAPETDSQTADTGQDRQERKDAARREALRAAESRVAALEARLEAIHRRDAERAVAAVLADPRDLWTAGVKLDELMTEDGELDAGKIKAAAERVVADRPHWRRRERVSDAGNHDTGNAPGAPQPTWRDVLKPRRG